MGDPTSILGMDPWGRVDHHQTTHALPMTRHGMAVADPTPHSANTRSNTWRRGTLVLSLALPKRGEGGPSASLTGQAAAGRGARHRRINGAWRRYSALCSAGDRFCRDPLKGDCLKE